MKRLAFLPLLTLCCGIALPSHVVRAQVSTMRDAAPTASVRNDVVEADLHSPADKHTSSPFLRTATFSPDRMYAVMITYPDGRPRMEGSYLDSALNIPDGDFTYYYANGQVESTGAYDHGYKSGTWKCFTVSGEPRADRIYYGMDWDHLQFLVGLAERAPTVGATEDNVAAMESFEH